MGNSTMFFLPLHRFIRIDSIMFGSLYNCRIIPRLDNDEMMENFAWRFGEVGCYKITGCEVMHQGLGVHGRYHLSFMPRTSVAEDFSVELALHCFCLKHVSELSWGVNADCGLIDVFGILKSTYNLRCTNVDGVLSKELALILEDNKPNHGWGPNELKCVLYGECAATTLAFMQGRGIQSGVNMVV